MPAPKNGCKRKAADRGLSAAFQPCFEGIVDNFSETGGRLPPLEPGRDSRIDHGEGESRALEVGIAVLFGSDGEDVFSGPLDVTLVASAGHSTSEANAGDAPGYHGEIRRAVWCVPQRSDGRQGERAGLVRHGAGRRESGPATACFANPI